MELENRTLLEERYKQGVRNQGYSKILDAVKAVANGQPIKRSPDHAAGFATHGPMSAVSYGEPQQTEKPSIEDRIYEESKSLRDEVAYLRSRLAAVFTLLDYYDSVQ